MSQVHEKLARQWLAMCERKERPALTIWETEQLLRGWLDRDRLRGALAEIRDSTYRNALMLRAIADRALAGASTNSGPVSSSLTPAVQPSPQTPAQEEK